MSATLLATVRRLLAEARQQTAQADPLLGELARDPAAVLTRAGLTPDPWQMDLLRCSDPRVLLLASRQVGKSRTAGALALKQALLKPGSLTLLLSPSQRQSGELFRSHVLPLYSALGRPLPATQESALQLTLANGSRIVSLPGCSASCPPDASGPATATCTWPPTASSSRRQRTWSRAGCPWIHWGRSIAPLCATRCCCRGWCWPGPTATPAGRS
jgi:hypothetical protein